MNILCNLISVILVMIFTIYAYLFTEVNGVRIINFKLNFPKIIIAISCIIAIIFVILTFFRCINLSSQIDIIMDDENYTNILKECHQNLDDYIGKTIHSTGYIFIPENFNKDEFVLARDMLINSSEAQIVGFMCEYENTQEYDENLWVEIDGTITKGYYQGELPLIKIKHIKKITTPENIFVYPPTK